MVDNFNFPSNLTKVFEVKDTSDTLRKFLLDLYTRVIELEKSNNLLKVEIDKLKGAK